jgi:hypothetical protein
MGGEGHTVWEELKKVITGQSLKEFLTPKDTLWGNVKHFALPVAFGAMDLSDDDKGPVQKAAGIATMAATWPMWGRLGLLPALLANHALSKPVGAVAGKIDKGLGLAPKPKVPKMPSPYQQMPPVPKYGV